MKETKQQIYNTSITPVGISTNDSPLFSVAFNQNINEVNEVYGTTFGGETDPAVIKTNRQHFNNTVRKLIKLTEDSKEYTDAIKTKKDINSFSKIMNYASEWGQSVPLFGFLF